MRVRGRRRLPLTRHVRPGCRFVQLFRYVLFSYMTSFFCSLLIYSAREVVEGRDEGEGAGRQRRRVEEARGGTRVLRRGDARRPSFLCVVLKCVSMLFVV